MKKIYKYLKILFVLTVLFFLAFLSEAVYKSEILRDIREQKDFKFFLVSTDEQNFLGGYILDYSIKDQSILVFPVNAKTRFIKNNTEKQVYLQDIYQKIYYRNKRNLNSSVKQFLGKINQIYDLDIDYFVHFSSADILNINSRFGENLDYAKIINSESNDTAILEKYFIAKNFLSIFNIFEFFRINNYNFSVETLKKWDENIKNTNINLKEIICLIMTFFKTEKVNLVFVGFSNVLYDEDNFYIRNMIKNVNTKSKEIVIEILNGSGAKGLALYVTRFLRDHNFDVQRWGNYGSINDATMIIDRKGYWSNAKTIANFLKTGVVFSKEDKNSFSDVSVILGRDFKSFN